MNKKLAVFDIESTGLLWDGDRITLICYKFLGEDKVYVCHDSKDFPADFSVSDGIKGLSLASGVIAHNGANFDIPFIEKMTDGMNLQHLEKFFYDGYMYDTMLASQTLFPTRNRHSLESWYPDTKVHNEEWGELTQNIIDRCITDVQMTEALYTTTMGEAVTVGYDINKAMKLEAAFAYLQAYQTQFGVTIDIDAAVELHKKLYARECELHDIMVRMAPKTIVPDVSTKYTKKKLCDLITDVSGVVAQTADPDTKVPSWVPKWQTKAGKPTASVTKWFDPAELKDANVQGPFTRIKYRELNPSSPGQMKDFLFTIGWQPTEWNSKWQDGVKVYTSPKLTEDSYDSIGSNGDSELGPMVKEYAITKHRRQYLLNIRKKDGKVTGILGNARVDGKVGADAITIGTPTDRCRHRGIVNTPSADALYGKDIRRLLLAEGKQIGIDLSGIEARVLAELCSMVADAAALIFAVTEGNSDDGTDFHTMNAKAWGVVRKVAKGILYAMIYGGGDDLLAGKAGRPGEGGKIKDEFFEAHPAAKALMDKCMAEFAAGERWMETVGGFKVYVDQGRKSLNRLIQKSAAIIFKYWVVYCHLYIPEFRQMKVRMMINMHDEIQVDSLQLGEADAKRIAQEIVNEVQHVQKDLGITCRLDADAKVGRDWYDCH